MCIIWRVIEISEEDRILSTCFSADGTLGEKSLVAGELELDSPFVSEIKIENINTLV